MPSALTQVTSAVPQPPTSLPLPDAAAASQGNGPGFAYEDHMHVGPLMIRGLVCSWLSVSTISIVISKFLYKSFTPSLSATWDNANGTALNGWDDDGSNLNNSDSKHYIWLLVNTTTGALATVAAYNKETPDITNAAFSGYAVAGLLTHFAVNGSGEIIDFRKVGNSFLFSSSGIQVGTHTGTAVATDTLTLAVPKIGQIQDVILHTYFDGTVLDERSSIGYTNTRGDSSIIFRTAYVNGSEIRGMPFYFPYSTETIYHSCATANLIVNHIMNVLGCTYNNMVGF